MASFGIVADIHGNLDALEVVLHELSARGIESVYCLGDLVGYCAEPNACVTLARERGFRCITGNHELIALQKLDFDRCGLAPAFALQRTRETLDEESRAYLETLPENRVHEGGILFVHGSVEDVCEYLSSPVRVLNNARTLRAHFPGTTVCFFGHTHVAKVYEVRGEHVIEHEGHGRVHLADDGAVRFVNPGSVDGSRDPKEKLARFAVFDEATRNVAFYAVRYDDAAVERQARRDGYRLPQTTLAWHRCVQVAERVAHAAALGAGAARARAARVLR